MTTVYRKHHACPKCDESNVYGNYQYESCANPTCDYTADPRLGFCGCSATGDST